MRPSAASVRLRSGSIGLTSLGWNAAVGDFKLALKRVKAGDWDDVPAMPGSYLGMWLGCELKSGLDLHVKSVPVQICQYAVIDDRRSHGSADGAEFLIAVGG